MANGVAMDQMFSPYLPEHVYGNSLDYSLAGQGWSWDGVPSNYFTQRCNEKPWVEGYTAVYLQESMAHELQDVAFTTVMLRNIPNKYTRDMLIEQLRQHNDEFDFIYMPIDFRNRCNLGYAFINFCSEEARKRFVTNFHGVEVCKCLPGLNSRKVAEVTTASIQGLSNNVQRLRNSPVMSILIDHPEWMPLIFDEVGNSLPFPPPEQPLAAMKHRKGKMREAALKHKAFVD